MKCCLYVMHDRVTEQHGEIFEAPNDATVRRSFTDLFKKAHEGMPVKDLVILCVATCDKSGSVPVITPVPVPYTVLRGDEISYDEARAFSVSAPDCDSSAEVVYVPVPEA